MRILLIGILMLSVLSACNGPAASIPRPTDTPASVSTDNATPFTPTSESSSKARPARERPSGIPYSSVADALADLKTRDGVSIEVIQGWTIVKEADGLTNWSFTPPDHSAYPAVAKRVLYRDQDGWHLKMDILCEAEKVDCEQFVRDFEAINGPMYQYIEHHQ
jgi:hypothetical protein